MPLLSELVEAMVERRRSMAAEELRLWAERDPDSLRAATALARSIGWGCPYHKVAEFKVSRRGRHYVGCAMEGCGAFHRDRSRIEPEADLPNDDDLPF